MTGLSKVLKQEIIVVIFINGFPMKWLAC